MTLISFVSGMVLLLSSISFARPNIQTVASLDLEKFLGAWYRIAANPIVFEPKCACARQVLGLTNDNEVSVYNSCNKKDPSGKLVEIRGTATPVNNDVSKLRVDFGLPWKGSYWIVAVDTDYRYAVVSDKNGYSLYIMSKTPTLSEELYAQAAEDARSRNVNVSRLKVQNNVGCSYPPER